jgi:hypothetical protein
MTLGISMSRGNVVENPKVGRLQEIKWFYIWRPKGEGRLTLEITKARLILNLQHSKGNKVRKIVLQ